MAVSQQTSHPPPGGATFTIRSASAGDLDDLIALDPLAATDADRLAHLRHATSTGECLLAQAGGQTIGFALFDYGFFGNGFLTLLYVAPAWRRHGAAQALIHYLEVLCRTPKLFTSINLSNRPMQALLEKAGYTLSGALHYLDEGDPELVYVKFLRQGVG